MAETFNTKDFAIYLPAINAAFASKVIESVPKTRPFPSGLSLLDLAFWDRGNRLFYHPYCLHSIGLYRVGSTIHNALTQAGRTDRVLVGDSGGFQIGHGKLGGCDELRPGMTAEQAEDAWFEADEVRNWIVTWLDTHCQYAMTLDIPLWATLGKNSGSPFHRCSHEQITRMTVHNLHYIQRNRRGRAKWLNVIHGIDQPSIRQWFDAVKWFKYGGWALAGNAGAYGGLTSVLRTVLMMRDEDAFSTGQDWVHVLGVSTIGWSLALSAIQRGLRKTNPNLSVSFDSASPFQQAGRTEEACVLPTLDGEFTNWRVRTERSPQGLVYVGSQDPFPFESAVASHLTLGHLNVYQGIYRKRRYDPISIALLNNHNVYVYLKAFDQANTLAFTSSTFDRIPMLYQRCISIISEAFDRPDWSRYLDSERSALEALS
jgi:hypothetical protein